MPVYTTQDIERFWKYVAIGKPNECWEWIGTITAERGQFSFGKNFTGAHRFSFWIHTGIWPGDLCVCHSCDNKICVNPKHLWLGTAKENTQDAVSKGRMARGSKHHNAKLNEYKVSWIKQLLDTKRYTQRTIASVFGVHSAAISSIKHGRTWSWVV